MADEDFVQFINLLLLVHIPVLLWVTFALPRTLHIHILYH